MVPKRWTLLCVLGLALFQALPAASAAGIERVDLRVQGMT